MVRLCSSSNKYRPTAPADNQIPRLIQYSVSRLSALAKQQLFFRRVTNQMSTSRNICLVGTIPEPIGGVSVHLERLAALCAQSGYTTHIYDLHPGRRKLIPQGCTLQSRPKRWQAALGYMFGRGFERFDLVHVHVSRIRPFLLLNGPLMLRHGMWGRVVLTFHSGALTEDLKALSRFELRGLSHMLRGCGKIIVVNSRQADGLLNIAGIESDRVAVIPAYLPLACAAGTNGDTGAGVRLPAERRVIVASGYGTPLYGWHDLIQAIKGLPSTWQWTFCFYNSYDHEYYQQIRNKCNDIPNVRVLEDLDPVRFHDILRDADTYVRPTTSDGDSIALREALALGLHCVASDAADRPNGVVVYPTSSIQSLCDTLLQLPRGRQERRESLFGERILSLYDEVYAASR